MRLTALKFIATVLAFGISTACCADDLIQWASNIDEARNQAARQNKLLLIHFWTPTCGPCKVIDKNVFPSPVVAQTINENFVALKVNAAKDTQLTGHFGVQQWPTDVISTVDGRALHRMVTDQNAMLYANKLAVLAKQHAISARYKPAPSNTPQIMARQQAQPAPRSVQQQPQQQPQQLATQNRFQAATPNQVASQQLPSQLPPQPGDPSRRAVRPGVNSNNLPGQGLGAAQPGYTPPQVGGLVGGLTPQTSDQFSKAPNRFESFSQPATPSTSNVAPPSQYTAPSGTVAGATGPNEIANPYTAPRTVAQRAPAQPPQVQPRFNNPVASNTNGPVANRAAGGFGAPPVSQPPVNMVAQQSPATTVAPPAAATRPQQDVTPTPVTQNPPVGLEGRCPVWLITNGSWKKGDKRWGAIHRGQTYLFSSQEAQQKFLSSPDDYSPVLAGMDVVRLAADNQVTQGTRRFGVLFDDDGEGPGRSRMFLFDSVESRNRFEADPDRYIQPVMAAMQSGNLDKFLR